MVANGSAWFLLQFHVPAKMYKQLTSEASYVVVLARTYLIQSSAFPTMAHEPADKVNPFFIIIPEA